MMTLFLKKLWPLSRNLFEKSIMFVCKFGALFFTPLTPVKTSHMEPAAAGVVTRPNGKRRRRCRQKGF